jgi:hypothetical protein
MGTSSYRDSTIVNNLTKYGNNSKVSNSNNSDNK